MAQPKTIEWLNKAHLQLFEVAAYINSQFGYQVATEFITNAFALTDRIAVYPDSGRPSKRLKSVRYVRLGKHHRMYYRVKGSVLIIIALIDTRQDPGKDPYR